MKALRSEWICLTGSCSGFSQWDNPSNGIVLETSKNFKQQTANIALPFKVLLISFDPYRGSQGVLLPEPVMLMKSFQNLKFTAIHHVQ